MKTHIKSLFHIVGQAARIVTTLQMLVNVIFVGVVARVLFGAALGDRARARQDRQPE